jgi:Zn-dependent protease
MDLDLNPFLKGLLWMTAFIAQASVHEAAHAWSAWKLGDGTAKYQGRLTLNPLAHIDLLGTIVLPLIAIIMNIPLIGWAKPVPVYPLHFRHPYRDMMLVALAGPFSNLILAAASILLLKGLDLVTHELVMRSLFAIGGDPLLSKELSLWDSWVLIISYWLVLSVITNVLLAAFNLIPIPPLDGSRVLSYFLPDAGKDFMHRLEPFGFLIVLGLLWINVLDRLVLIPVLSKALELLVIVLIGRSF